MMPQDRCDDPYDPEGNLKFHNIVEIIWNSS